MPMPKPQRYSIHVIDAKGNPVPRSGSKSKFGAISLAEMIAQETGLEVRVWNTQEVRVIYTIPAMEAAHAAA